MVSASAKKNERKKIPSKKNIFLSISSKYFYQYNIKFEINLQFNAQRNNLRSIRIKMNIETYI